VLFLMLSAHFPQVTSAAWNIPILAVLVVTLMYGKYLLNSRNQNPNWLVSLLGSLTLAGILIGVMIVWPEDSVPAPAKTKTSGEVVVEPVIDPNVKAGAKLFISQTCATCHQGGSSQLGPSLNGIYGKTVILADNTRVVANDAYLRSSILNPQEQIVKGYPAAMPSFAYLEPEQVDQLVAYIKSLK
jgi:mono/diheme cytochrome c family protein